MTTFKELDLKSEINKSLLELGFEEPSPIQSKAIPFLLKSKKDLIALAQTGTGKTAAFSLPILNQIKDNEKDLVSIILCPTRELCLQISEDIKKFARYLPKTVVTAVYGGERIDIQIRALKKMTNIVVGTPGRVHDLIRRNILDLKKIKWLVLDEADEMLDMGFKDDLDAILQEIPKEKQTLLFSATISKSVHSIAKQYMKEAEEISIGEKNTGAENISYQYYVVQARDRFEALRRILDFNPGVYGILFCRTRNQTQEVADKLKQLNYDTEALHGEVTQAMRTKVMDRFKQKKIRLLVATDVAARGIDVSNLSHVINYNLPDQNEAYTHRSGRTGRANKSGVSISIVSPREVRRIGELERVINKKIEFKKIPSGEEIIKKQIDDFLQKIEDLNVKEIKDEDLFEEIVSKLKKINKEDLIKYFLNERFKNILRDYKRSSDLNVNIKNLKTRKVNDNNSVNLKINFGRKHRFDIRTLFTLINANKSLKGVEVGRIKIMSEYSLFSVDKNYSDRMIRSLRGINFRGRKIDITIGGNAINHYRNRRRNSSPRFYKKKDFN